MTVDTGATMTIISSKIYDVIPKKYRPELTRTNMKRLTGADGKIIKYRGKATFDLELGDLKLTRKVTVADIEDDMLLGADIIQNDVDGPADLLLSEGRMVFHGVNIPLEQIGLPSKLRKVRVVEEHIVPGMSEMILDVIVDTVNDQSSTVCIIEPCNTFLDKYPLCLAPTLVDVSGNNIVKTRVINPFTNQVTIKQNTVVGFAESVMSEVHVLLATESDEKQSDCIRRIQLTDHSPLMNDRNDVHAKLPKHLKDTYDEASSDKTDDENVQIKNLLSKYEDVFSKDEYDLGLTKLAEHVIDTEDVRPIKHRPRRVPMAFQVEDKKAIDKLLKQGSIRLSSSPWASPLVLIKKRDGSTRPCVDYRGLNSVTKKDAFPLPRIQDCLDAMSGAKVFSTLDITSAYNQVPVREQDIPKTAFVTKHGLFEYTTMPFGMCNSVATFQRVIELALNGLQWNICLIYLDDMIVFSTTVEEHTMRLDQVLKRIKEAGLKLKPQKCHLYQKQVTFLGHIVSEKGLSPNPENVVKIVKCPVPTTVSEVRTILGMGSYYRRFVKDFSKRVHPTNEETVRIQMD